MLFTTTVCVSPSETPQGDTVVLLSFPGQIFFFSRFHRATAVTLLCFFFFLHTKIYISCKCLGSPNTFQKENIQYAWKNRRGYKPIPPCPPCTAMLNIWIILFLFGKNTFHEMWKSGRVYQCSLYLHCLSPDRCEHSARIKLRQMNQWIHTITPQTPMSYDFPPLWFYFYRLNAGYI